MQRNEVVDYCLGKKGAVKSYPFDQETLVLKVGVKMFALLGSRQGEDYLNLKCDPALAGILRQTYPAVTPGYHMNKEHWNSVALNGTLPDDELRQMVDHSYDLVLASLSKTEKLRISAMG